MYEFRVLGPLEVLHDGRSLELNAPMIRKVLVTLLCHPHRPISPQLLADSLWEGQPPASARKNIQGYAMRLRQALRAGEDPDHISSPARLVDLRSPHPQLQKGPRDVA